MLYVVSGALALLVGIIAMVWPLETAVAVVVLWGILILLDGLGVALVALLDRELEGRLMLLVGAALALLVALFAIFRPNVAAATAVWVVGVWLVVRGLFDSVQALRSASGTTLWLLLAGAAFTVALGVLFLARPGGSLTALTFVLGFLTALRGLALIVSGLRTRQALTGTSLGTAVT
jgi:uncharacterized membrane protein HdeD (DUF308 family)